MQWFNQKETELQVRDRIAQTNIGYQMINFQQAQALEKTAPVFSTFPVVRVMLYLVAALFLCLITYQYIARIV